MRELTCSGVAMCWSALGLLVLCFSNTVNQRGAALGYWLAKKKLIFELTRHLNGSVFILWQCSTSASLMHFFWRYSSKICYNCSVFKISFQSVVSKLVSYNLGQWRECVYIELTAFSASVRLQIGFANVCLNILEKGSGRKAVKYSIYMWS